MARGSLIAVSLALVAPLLAVPLVVRADDAAAGAPVRRFVRVPAPDGIQIRRYNKTDGKSPDEKDRVVVHYHGTLKDGTVFDSSLKSGHPAVFSLKKVVPCWKEALKRMHVGEEARLTCPPDTAYGPKGSPPVIPPNATLNFEIELVGIQ
jgi:FKBP-type peptidyl-prolyl cis-trans isomerase FkpA